MPITQLKTSFVGGELSPALAARPDIQKYHEGCRSIQNAVVRPEGGVANRAGTRWISYADNGNRDSKVRLVRFSNGATQSYCLIFGEGFIHVIKGDDVIIGSYPAYYNIAAPYNAAALPGLRFSQSADTLFITHVDYPDMQLTCAGDTDWTLAEAPSGPDPVLDSPRNLEATTDATNYAYVITAVSDEGVESNPSNPAHGKAEAALTWAAPLSGRPQTYRVYRKVNHTGISDDGRDAWRNYGFIATVKGSLTTYTVPSGADPDITQRPPDYIDWERSDNPKSVTDITYAPPSITVSCANHGYQAGDAVYLTGIFDSATPMQPTEISERWFTIDYVTTDTFTLADEASTPVYPARQDATNSANADCRRVYPVFRPENYYPAVSAIYQQRKIVGGSTAEPQTLFGSRVGSLEVFGTDYPATDSSPFEHVLDATELSRIVALVPLQELLVFTDSAEWVISGGNAGEAITTTQVWARIQSHYGCADLQPLVIGDSVLFVQAGNAAVRTAAYTTEGRGYRGIDVAFPSRHLLRDYTIVDWAYQRTPDPVVWLIRSDGTLLGLTYQPELEIIAWHRHVTQGSYEAVCVVPDGQGGENVYVAVRRVINGEDYTHIEKFERRLPDGDIEKAWFLDAATEIDEPVTLWDASQTDPVVIQTSGPNFSVGDLVDIRGIEGMTELNGGRYRVAGVVGNTFELTDPVTGDDIDGTAYGAYTGGGTARKAVTTVSGLGHLVGLNAVVWGNGAARSYAIESSSLTLSEPASIIRVGLPFVTEIETVDFVFEGRRGTTRDKQRQIVRVTVELEETRALSVGTSPTTLHEVLFRQSEPFGAPTAPYTGLKTVDVAPGDGKSSRVYLRNSAPAPLCILALMPQIEIGEG